VEAKILEVVIDNILQQWEAEEKTKQNISNLSRKKLQIRRRILRVSIASREVNCKDVNCIELNGIQRLAFIAAGINKSYGFVMRNF
jgi:hypothetical protein